MDTQASSVIILLLLVILSVASGCKGGGNQKAGRKVDCSLKGSYCVCHECECDYGQIQCGGGGEEG